MARESRSHDYSSRVALARAVYSPAKCVLLDDPLSAVVCLLGRTVEPQLTVGRNRIVTLRDSCLRNSSVAPF
jgi:ABC-type sugar transport system ATPase subunit